MADFLSTSVSGLSSVQRALDVLSHNVSNAYTEGYTRQNVTLSAREPQYTGQGAVGSGTALVNIQRGFDQFLGKTLQTELTEQGRLASRDLILQEMDSVLGEEGNNLSSRLTQFFNAAQDVANAPSDLSVRSVFLDEANNLAVYVKTLDRRLADIDQGLAQRSMRLGGEVNEISGELARLNESILDARNRFPGHEPNDLLDRRDLLLRNLAKKIDIQTFEDQDGNLNVSVGNGQALVLADQSFPMDVGNDAAGLSIMVGDTEVTKLVRGGELGGLMRVKEEILDPKRAELGRVVYSLVTRFNQVHGTGDDLNGTTGTSSFFNVTSVGTPVSAEPKISPPAYGLSVTITNVNNLTASDYMLKHEGGQWNLYKSGQASPIVSPVTSGSSSIDLTASEGIRIEYTSLPSSPGAGDPDRVSIRPLAGEMANLAVNVTDPAKIAASSTSEGPGGNGNMLALAAIASEGNVVAGSMSLSTANATILADFGAEARGARVSLEAQNLVVKQAQDRRDSMVGVNLDEEAANLIRLQNHYMALSKSISVADTLFQSLLQAAS